MAKLKDTTISGALSATGKITSTVAGASTSTIGTVKLNSATNSASTTEAATPSAVKAAYDLANEKVSFSVEGSSFIEVHSSEETLNDFKKQCDLLMSSMIKKYVAFFGDGETTTILINHKLDTKDIVFAITDKDTNQTIFTDSEIVDENNIKLVFDVAPSENQYKIVVMG